MESQTNGPTPRVLVIHRSRGTVTIDGREVDLSPGTRLVLEALATGKVVTRAGLARAAGLESLSPRRCEGLLVEVRHNLGPDVIRNLRRRGWMLTVPAVIQED